MSEDQEQLYLEGVTKFQGARAKAFWQEVFSLLRGQSTELLSFEEVRARLRLRAESYRGLQDIPLANIVGSVGRYRDFTNTFLPRANDLKERWSRVYAQANSMVGLPPIEVYKVGDVYFVRDGNHRVSVARQLGAETIQAHVTELPTSVRLEPGMTLRDLDAAASYAAFLDETQLDHTRPRHQSMELSEPSRYPELMGHIYLHAQVLERALGHPVSTEDAAANWYDNVYRPAITLIRKYNILDLTHDKRRTEADVYLWMVDHLREARQQFGDEANRRFSQALVEYLNQKKIPIPRELLTEEDESAIISRGQVMQALEEYRRRLSQPPPPEDHQGNKPAANGNSAEE
ncbi:MAG: hypothetical protein NZ750_10105 [Anaerolineae bacterium]|nr:hypothetical protein [Anaerolineae bacterium]MDW8172635.1 hypothetical protein [Anaerolineae bacterium]